MYIHLVQANVPQGSCRICFVLQEDKVVISVHECNYYKQYLISKPCHTMQVTSVFTIIWTKIHAILSVNRSALRNQGRRRFRGGLSGLEIALVTEPIVRRSCRREGTGERTDDGRQTMEEGRIFSVTSITLGIL